MLQYRFRIESVLEVPASAFEPVPQVASAVARLLPAAQREPAHDEALLAGIVTSAFSQRRKTLRNTLKHLLKNADFEQLRIDPGARAQELAVADFVRIANHVAPAAAQE